MDAYLPGLQLLDFATMDDLTFLDDLDNRYASGDGTLKVALPNGQIHHISDRISPHRLLDRCPLLYHVFEYGHQSRFQASIEAPSRNAVIALLRYCYTSSYLPMDADTECTPLLFLPHVEVYKIAQDFDVPELALLAQGNFSCQIDYACCLPNPPHDLLETIRFVYQHFSGPHSRQHESLVQTLLNYCISVFQYQQLGENEQFLGLVRDMPEFRQGLCRTNMDRNFQDDCALEIIQLRLDTPQPHCGPRPTTLASRDLPLEMLIDRPVTPSRAAACDSVRDVVDSNESECSSDDNLEDSIYGPNSPIPGPSTLAFRPQNAQPTATTGFDTDSSSEDEGFSLVYRPKSTKCPTPDDPMSSPEIIPSNPTIVNVLAITGSTYPDDDDWTML